MKGSVILFMMVIAILNIANAQTKVTSIPSNLNYPEITEGTKDVAYEAPSSKLVGTWVSKNHELTFKSDGTCILTKRENGLEVIIQGRGTWIKKGDNLSIKIAPTGWSLLIADKEAYNQLSARKKADFDEKLKILNSKLKSRGDRVNAEGKISFLNSDFFYYTSEGWYVNKNSLSKLEAEAKEKVEAEAKEKAKAQEEEKAKAEKIFLSQDREPSFPGGLDALKKWLSNHVNYPESARQNNIQGRVKVGFTINEDGSIGDLTIIDSVHPILDNYTIEIVKQMPNWIPAVKDGKRIKSKYALPLTFRD